MSDKIGNQNVGFLMSRLISCKGSLPARKPVFLDVRPGKTQKPGRAAIENGQRLETEDLETRLHSGANQFAC